MARFTLFILLLSIVSSSCRELLLNGDFGNFDKDWTFTCYPNPICDQNLCHETFGSGYYLRARAPCQLIQCISGGGELTFQASSPDLDITFDDQPFVGVLTSNNIYRGNVTCQDEYCCLKINFTNTVVYLDNISLQNKEFDPAIIILIILGLAICLVFTFLIVIRAIKYYRDRKTRYLI